MVYGFSIHRYSFKALKIRRYRKCVSVKEEANSSHVDQADNSLTVLSNNKSTVGCISLVRLLKYQVRGMVDQWILVHVGFHMIQNTTEAVYIGSFKRVNLHPHHHLSFLYWCRNISVPLLGVHTFEEETPVETYAMLLLFWHVIDPYENNRAVEIIDQHDGFSPACVLAL